MSIERDKNEISLKVVTELRKQYCMYYMYFDCNIKCSMVVSCILSISARTYDFIFKVRSNESIVMKSTCTCTCISYDIKLAK